MSKTAANLIRFLRASMLIILMAAALNFAVDPLQLFRAARFYPAVYSADSRMQNAGLIRSQDFDTVFMGTSLGVHFRQSDIDRHFGVRSLKLATAGSTSAEQRFILDAALRHHPKLVIWGMDEWIFRDAPNVDSEAYMPADLYRMNAKGVAGYLLGLDTTRESLWALLRTIKPLHIVAHGLAAAQYLKFYETRVNEINALPASVDLTSFYNAAKSQAAYAYNLKNPSEISAGYNYEAMVRNFERDAIGLIEKNPDVEFRIYFPPYSILQFVAMREIAPDTLQLVYKFSAYVVERLLSLPNVTVSDFRDAQDITHDLNNYLDLLHHSPVVDLKVLSGLAAGEHAVRRAAPLASIKRLQSQVEAYRPKLERKAGD
jgi:hypothetical protein